MKVAQIKNEAVGGIFGPKGCVIESIRKRHNIGIKANKEEGDYRLIFMKGETLNIFGALSEIIGIVGAENIIISPQLIPLGFAAMNSEKSNNSGNSGTASNEIDTSELLLTDQQPCIHISLDNLDILFQHLTRKRTFGRNESDATP